MKLGVPKFFGLSLSTDGFTILEKVVHVLKSSVNIKITKSNSEFWLFLNSKISWLSKNLFKSSIGVKDRLVWWIIKLVSNNLLADSTSYLRSSHL